MFKKFTVLYTLTFFLLEGCGFTPLYKQEKGITTPLPDVLNTIYIDPIPNRTGQILRNKLRTLLHSSSTQDFRYVLSVSMKFHKKDFGILTDATASRSEIVVTGTYTLKEKDTQKILLSRNLETSSNFNLITDADYSLIVAEDTSVKTAIDLLAQDIQLSLASYFHTTHSSKTDEA